MTSSPIVAFSYVLAIMMQIGALKYEWMALTAGVALLFGLICDTVNRRRG